MEQLAGQLFITGFSGEYLSESSPIIRDITERNLGGVILFDKLLAHRSQVNNITSLEQVRNLTQSLQETAQGNLIIGVDQEGGKVSRFRPEFGFPQTRQAAELGSNEDTDQTQKAAAATASLLHNAGFNCNFAPVVDLNTFPENPIIGKYGRSFSTNAQNVTRHATAWIQEHHKQQVGCCLKHFPGHGSSRADSHLGFVDITDTWDESELLPYRSLVRQGLADAVMTGHLYNRNLDPDYPATLSAKTIGLLKDELHYEGPVFSDDMQMGAIISRYGFEKAVCMALKAGVDMVIIGNNLCHEPEVFARCIDEVLRQIKSGELPEQRLQDAHTRVQRFKQRFCSTTI